MITGQLRRVQVSEDIWCFDHPLRLFGAEFGARMTVVRYEKRSNDLIIFSPINPTGEVVEHLSKLGEVKLIVAPNQYHNLFIVPFSLKYPKAKVYAVKEILERNKEVNTLPVNWMPSETPPLCDEFELCSVHIPPYLHEVIFFHRLSRALILTDLCFNMEKPKERFYDKFFFFLYGPKKKFGSSNLTRFFLKKNENASITALKKIISWNFDIIILTHGPLILSNGKRQFLNEFKWLLG